ncbi:MAG: hypothetical protein ACLFUJ_06410 [Phycisphaerae bacterium]
MSSEENNSLDEPRQAEKSSGPSAPKNIDNSLPVIAVDYFCRKLLIYPDSEIQKSLLQSKKQKAKNDG